MDLLVRKQTVGARQKRAFAIASGYAPPRPYPLRELFALYDFLVIKSESRTPTPRPFVSLRWFVFARPTA